MGRNDWLVRKGDTPEPLLVKKTKAYEHWNRASETYGHWLTGKTEEEISVVMDLSVDDVKKDIWHIEAVLPTKQLISNNNTRNRLLIQREQAAAYQKKLNETLTISARDFLAAGLNPVTPLKEYREAVGMQEKPGGLNIQVNQNNANVSGGVSRTEDVVRSVLDRIKAARSANDNTVIDAEYENVIEAKE